MKKLQSILPVQRLLLRQTEHEQATKTGASNFGGMVSHQTLSILVSITLALSRATACQQDMPQIVHVLVGSHYIMVLVHFRSG